MPICKGNIYRYKETAFPNKNGELIWKRNLRRLKKESCPGCDRHPYCQSHFHNEIFDYFSDTGELPALPEKIKHNDKVKLWSSGCNEGLVDMWFVVVESDHA